jgi:hypothetical protein
MNLDQAYLYFEKNQFMDIPDHNNIKNTNLWKKHSGQTIYVILRSASWKIGYVEM